MILYFYEHFMGDDILTRNNLPVAKMLTMMHAVNANGKRTHQKIMQRSMSYAQIDYDYKNSPSFVHSCCFCKGESFEGMLIKRKRMYHKNTIRKFKIQRT